MALGSFLLQRSYISAAKGVPWLSVQIERAHYGKPYSGNLHYNVSHVDGIVVLVGWSAPVGVDIVSRSLDSTMLSLKDLESIFSAAERQNLAVCGDSKEFNDLYNVIWAFKEAYMKYTGVPQWDSITSKEFRNIRIPKTAGEYYTQAVSDLSMFVDGSNRIAYTECHNLFDSHFVAIYSPSKSLEENLDVFREKKLEDILPRDRQDK
jgi:phosphopantetheinyl transferase